MFFFVPDCHSANIQTDSTNGKKRKEKRSLVFKRSPVIFDFCSARGVCDAAVTFHCSFMTSVLVLTVLCVCVFVCAPPQTFADTPPTGSPVPQLLEDPAGSPDRGSPVSNPASANTATNPESVSRSADLQVCHPLSALVSILSLLTHPQTGDVQIHPQNSFLYLCQTCLKICTSSQDLKIYGGCRCSLKNRCARLKRQNTCFV